MRLGRFRSLGSLCVAMAARLDHTYRMVALDMDGTLLNNQHQLSPASVETLRSLADRGVDIALCSGRSAPAMQSAAETLDLNRPMPMVSYNGALGLRARVPGWTTSADELFKISVPDDAVDAVLRLADSHDLLVQYYVGEHIHVVCKNDEHRRLCERYVELTGVEAHVHEASYSAARALGPPYKLLVMGDAVDDT